MVFQTLLLFVQETCDLEDLFEAMSRMTEEDLLTTNAKPPADQKANGKPDYELEPPDGGPWVRENHFLLGKCYGKSTCVPDIYFKAQENWGLVLNFEIS
jgi:hypothetical protein